jgi:flagellar hook assembly protein FlgD
VHATTVDATPPSNGPAPARLVPEELKVVRKIISALAVALLASLGVFAPAGIPAAHAASGVKVAIIVGATHSTTPRYRDDADEIYAEAIKYSDNVVKVYSPKATASKVKAAVNGASIVVYLGHGNGWPSPYTYDPNYTTKDGFGLNYDLNGDGKTTDYENKYYGEPWIRDLNFAPNAVVLLFHLCYASGNSESGSADPSLSTAKKRVDNYAAAFLQAGARAVIASGHSHDPYYIRGLFTTRQTIEDYWRSSPDANGNFAEYPSERNPGYTFQMDPDRPGSYYRSIAGKMSLRTQDVTGAPYADTSRDPASMVVPGNASPAVDGAPVYGSIEAAVAGVEPSASLPADTHVRVDAREWASSVVDGSPIYHVTAGAVEGWMTGSSLVPRDSAAPQVWEVDDGTGTFSPDGDGSGDSLHLSVRLSETAAWTMRILDSGDTQLRRVDGASSEAALTWSPSPGSVAEGTYRWTLEATDGWGNGPLRDEGTITVDLTSPDAVVAEPEDVVPVFSPNGDGTGDSVGFSVGANEPGTVVSTVRNLANEIVDQASTSLGSSVATVAWDGRDESGHYVPDGQYRVAFVALDQAGNQSRALVRTVAVYAALGNVAVSKPAFYPQDGDSLGRSVTLSFRLRDAAQVTWAIENGDGATVRTIKADEALDAGTYTFAWDGRDDGGAFVPRGTYASVVAATDGTLAATQRAIVVADAFAVAVSDETPGRGQKIKITVTSAETLSRLPKLRIYQPGATAWTVTMQRVSGKVYRATITLKGGQAGTMRLRVTGWDKHGSKQRSNRYLPIH